MDKFMENSRSMQSSSTIALLAFLFCANSAVIFGCESCEDERVPEGIGRTQEATPPVAEPVIEGPTAIAENLPAGTRSTVIRNVAIEIEGTQLLARVIHPGPDADSAVLVAERMAPHEVSLWSVEVTGDGGSSRRIIGTKPLSDGQAVQQVRSFSVEDHFAVFELDILPPSAQPPTSETEVAIEGDLVRDHELVWIAGAGSSARHSSARVLATLELSGFVQNIFPRTWQRATGVPTKRSKVAQTEPAETANTFDLACRVGLAADIFVELVWRSTSQGLIFDSARSHGNITGALGLRTRRPERVTIDPALARTSLSLWQTFRGLLGDAPTLWTTAAAASIAELELTTLAEHRDQESVFWPRIFADTLDPLATGWPQHRTSLTWTRISDALRNLRRDAATWTVRALTDDGSADARVVAFDRPSGSVLINGQLPATGTGATDTSGAVDDGQRRLINIDRNCQVAVTASTSMIESQSTLVARTARCTGQVLLPFHFVGFSPQGPVFLNGADLVIFDQSAERRFPLNSPWPAPLVGGRIAVDGRYVRPLGPATLVFSADHRLVDVVFGDDSQGSVTDAAISSQGDQVAFVQAGAAFVASRTP